MKTKWIVKTADGKHMASQVYDSEKQTQTITYETGYKFKVEGITVDCFYDMVKRFKDKAKQEGFIFTNEII